MLGWLLNLVYLATLLAFAPLIAWRSLRHGRYRRGWREKLLGSLPLRTDQNRPLVWLHAVSVGEVVLLGPLIRRWRSERPDLQVLVTTSTDGGYDVAREKLTGCDISWLPLDFTWSVRRALHRVRPDLVVLAELELWPNLVRAVAAAGVPIALINARLSERSHRGYQRLRFLFAPLLERLSLIAVQNDTYGERFRSLGAAAEKVVVTGSIKFDGVESERQNLRTDGLRELLHLPQGIPVFIAGSTQSPEELAAVTAWETARKLHPELRLIVVPRHRERFGEVAELIRSRGHVLLRRSELASSPTPTAADDSAVVLIDTLGELGAIWGLADIAYVGGSLTPGRGGQNMLEPAAYGAAVMVGPHTENFREIVHTLRAAGGLEIVPDAHSLTAQLQEWLQSPQRRQQQGAAARRCVLDQQGATTRTVAALSECLPSVNAMQQRAA